MSKKQPKIETRVFEVKKNSICIDMGKSAEGSWVKAVKCPRGVWIDSSNMDGELLLDYTHARILGELLLEWSDQLRKRTVK